MIKHCRKCVTDKDSSEFNKDKSTKDGLAYECRQCTTLYQDARKRRLYPEKYIVVEVPVGQKICRRCEAIKNVSDFGFSSRSPDGLLAQCRDCYYGKPRRKRALEDISDGLKTCTKCLVRKTLDNFFETSDKRVGYTSRCKACISERSAEFYQENRDRLLVKNNAYNAKPDTKKRNRDKRIDNPEIRLRSNLRTRFWQALKNDFKTGSAVRDLGCSIENFKDYLESLFQPDMTWANYGKGPGKWNIDHNMPVTAFDLTDRQHLLLCCHYLNLQPMWFEENMKKFNKTCHLASIVL